MGYNTTMEIILYDSRSLNSEPVSPEIPIIPASTSSIVMAPPLSPSRSKSAFSHLGRYFLFIAAAGVIYTGLPVIIPKIESELRPQAQLTPVQTTFEQVLNLSFSENQALLKQQEEKSRALAQEEAQKYGVETDFSIVIPKISAAAKVIPNVDPGNEEEYRSSLKAGVAHAKGSGFPGGNNTIYLFAHSTNTLTNVSLYNAVFYQLRDLEAGDKIIIFFTGQKFIYQVLNQQIVEAKDISWLTDTGEEKLVLQTCWPPGISLKRLIVIARPV